MRKGNNVQFISDESGRFVALSLGADYCAEHEWGIKVLSREFGFGDPDKFGLERRKITCISPLLRWVRFDTKVHRDGKSKLVERSGFWIKSWTNGSDAPEVLEAFYDTALWTGWSERDFGAFSCNAAEVSKLRELYDHMLELDAAIWLGGGGVFENAGLAIAIASRLSIDIVSKWESADREYAQLKKDAETTGIEKKLRKAGLKWFALSPSRQSDGSIQWWLNPLEQNRYEACWATLQDLEDWIAGKGKIVKNQSKRKAK